MFRLLPHSLRLFLGATPRHSFSSVQNQAVVTEVKNGFGFVRFSQPDSKVNVLSAEFSQALENGVNQLEQDSSVKAIILISSKPDCFIAGADIGMLASCTNAAQLTDISSRAQNAFEKFEKGKPKVAAIDGSCLGGGLEVALACHSRVASQNPKTQLGLPEVKLGLLPGAGGTQRLPRLVALPKALDMMLTGSTLNAQSAKKAGLVDIICDKNALEAAAVEAAKALLEKKPLRPAPSLVDKVTSLATGLGPVRSFILKRAREQVQKLTGGHYPAPFAILDVVEAGLSSQSQGYALESLKFGELGQTPQSKALISIFNGQNSCKKNVFGESKPVKTIGVLGAGLMGAGITQVSIDKGYQVLLKDMNEQALGRGLKQIYDNLAAKLKKKRITEFELNQTLARIVKLKPEDNWGHHFRRADLVIEAVFEDLAVKHKVIAELEQFTPEHCIIATNTSAIPIESIAKGSKRPERVIGMHYFSPVDKMPLLEIIPTSFTAKEVCSAAFEVGNRQSKTVIVVKDVPGFFVNRCLGPYMAETFALLRDGVDPQQLDSHLKSFGLPVGPITLADEVGLDVASHVQSFLAPHLGVRMKGADVSFLGSFLENKSLGRKTGKGFFTYTTNSKKKVEKAINPELTGLLEKLRAGKQPLDLSSFDIQHRMIARYINEAIYCLQDEIIRTPTDGDIGSVFGMGFPPFLGGPFRYVDSFGVQKFHDLLLKYTDQYGEQFQPAPLLKKMASEGTRFHN